MPALENSLLDFARNEHSQNGEDGIVARIFDVIGETTRLCGEFGAWDGLHLSNTRALVERGWRGVMIERDPERFAALTQTYPAGSGVLCIEAAVDDEANTVGRLLAAAGVEEELDFLSIDVDGADYYLFRALDVRPRVVCVEANGANVAESLRENPRAVASHDVNQPLALFVEAGRRLGYRLVGYSLNAFFVRDDAGHDDELPTLSAAEAYDDYLRRLDERQRLAYYLANRGLVHPHHVFRNPRLTRRRLGLSWRVTTRAVIGLQLQTGGGLWPLLAATRSRMSRLGRSGVLR